MNARLVFKLSEDGFRSEPHRRLPKTIRMFGERSFCSRRYNFNLSAVCIGTRAVHSEQSLQDKTNIVKDPPDQTFQKMLVVSAIALTKSHCICARGLCFRYLCQGHLLCFTFLLIRASAQESSVQAHKFLDILVQVLASSLARVLLGTNNFQHGTLINFSQ